MKSLRFAAIGMAAAGLVALSLVTWLRIHRVLRAGAAIPVYPGAREGGGRTRYWPHLLSWDDRSSARVQRVFALPQATSLVTIARHAQTTLTAQGWYLVTPIDFERPMDSPAQLTDPPPIVWQREPDERLDLTQLWPLRGLSRAQRLYGGIFPAAFLDAPLVIEWSWALGGPRSPPPAPLRGPAVRPAPPAPPPR